MTFVAGAIRAIGAVTGGGKVVNDPTVLTVRPDSFTPIILKWYVAAAERPVSATDAVVGAPPSTIPGTTVAVVDVVNVASGPYSKLKVVGANPGLTSIKTSALWCVMFVTLFCATTGGTIGAPPSVGETYKSLFTVSAFTPVITSLVDSASRYCATCATDAFGLSPR